MILKYAGKDATEAYEPIHPPNALDKNLSSEKHLGPIDQHSAEEIKQANKHRKRTQDETRVEKAQQQKPPLNRVLNLSEMEVYQLVTSNSLFAYFLTTFFRPLLNRSYRTRLGHTTHLQVMTRSVRISTSLLYQLTLNIDS